MNSPSSKDSETKPLDKTQKAIVGLARLSRRPIKTFEQLESLLQEVSAAHDEVLKHGTPEQIKRVAEFEKTGTDEFRLAFKDRQRMRELIARFATPRY